jgi:hypothetical protein
MSETNSYQDFSLNPDVVTKSSILCGVLSISNFSSLHQHNAENDSLLPPFEMLFKKMILAAGEWLKEQPQIRSLFCGGSRFVFATPALPDSPKQQINSHQIASSLSAALSPLFGKPVVFSADIYAFPNLTQAVDYVCDEMRKQDLVIIDALTRLSVGKSCSDPKTVELIVSGMTAEDCQDLLNQNGLSPQELPKWLTQGSILYHSAKSGEDAKLHVDFECPNEPEDTEYLRAILKGRIPQA